MSDICVNLLEFIRTGCFGPVHFAITREDLQRQLGPTDMCVFAFRRDREPTILSYGDAEFYFMSSDDNRLHGIVLHASESLSGDAGLQIVANGILPGMPKQALVGYLDANSISWREGPDEYNPKCVIITVASGVMLRVTEEATEFGPPMGLFDISHYSNMVPKERKLRQVNVPLPLPAYRAIRDESVRTRRRIAHICRDWIIERAEGLDTHDS
jgi:hypothetical protein